MGRQILFRGKNAAGDFVYGSLLESHGFYEIHGKHGFCSVKNDTIGQFIGKSDKKRNKFFEGDVVERIYHPLGTSLDVAKYYIIGVVVYYDCCFSIQYKIDGLEVLDEKRALSHQKNRREIHTHPTGGANWIDNRISWNTWRVIGNIFDNPQLINPTQS